MNGGIVGWTLYTAVPAVVVVGPVLVILAISLIVFLVVAHQVVQGEAIVAGNEIDAGIGLAPVALVQVATTAQACGKLRHRATVAFPEAPHGIAVLAVPLTPEDGEIAHLITTRTHVPRLGDELDLRQEGILVNNVEKGSQ